MLTPIPDIARSFRKAEVKIRYVCDADGGLESAPGSTRRIQMQHRLGTCHLMELAILWHDRYTVSNACCRDNTPILHAYVKSSGCNVRVEIRHLRSFPKAVCC